MVHKTFQMKNTKQNPCKARMKQRQSDNYSRLKMVVCNTIVKNTQALEFDICGSYPGSQSHE